LDLIGETIAKISVSEFVSQIKEIASARKKNK